MFYCVKYFSISIMRFKITSALILHRFIKISLRRMFSRSVSGFVLFLSLADFVSRDKNLQVADLQRLKLCFGGLATATTSNHQNPLFLKSKIQASPNDRFGVKRSQKFFIHWASDRTSIF